LVVMAYEDFQETALGLSFALALAQPFTGNSKRSPHSERTNFAFLGRSPQSYNSFWQKLQVLKTGITPQNLWLIAPGLRKSDFPAQLSLDSMRCQIDIDRYHRVGVPYQGYRCKSD